MLIMTILPTVYSPLSVVLMSDTESNPYADHASTHEMAYLLHYIS